MAWKQNRAARSTPAQIALLLMCVHAGLATAADFALSGHVVRRHGAIALPIPDTLSSPGPGMVVEGTVTQMGAPVPGGGPATIVIPPRVVSAVPTTTRGVLIVHPHVIQISSRVTWYGPDQTTTLMAGRAGRGTFAYCPGASANPTCTTVAAGGSQGTVDGIIKYTGGPNHFGGTFRLLASGVARVSVKGGSPRPLTAMTSMGATRTALPFSVRNFLLNASGETVGVALPYATMLLRTFSKSPRTHPYGYMETPMGLLSRGQTVSPGVSQVLSTTAFPLTTGQVYAFRKQPSQNVSSSPISKFTITGYDARTADGAGRIVLVGASLSRTYPVDGSDPPEGSNLLRVQYSLNFTPQPAVGAGSAVARAALVLAMLGASHWAVKRRSS